MIKALLTDFDGTIVNEDLLTFACALMGKREESIRLNEAFSKDPSLGIKPLTERINFLKGLSVEKLHFELDRHDFLISGAEELFSYLKANNIKTVLHSGNLISILSYFQKKLGIDWIIGSHEIVEDGIIKGIKEEAYRFKDFKLEETKLFLREHRIRPDECIAIGDGPADISIFELVGKERSIAINPQQGIEEYCKYKVENLNEVIDIIGHDF